MKRVRDDPSVRCSVSLFSGGGIGDVGVQYGAGVPVIACSELDGDRATLLRSLFPDASVHEGDIRTTKHSIVHAVQTRLQGRRPFLLVMSPPCQGMSLNGIGRIGDAVERGLRAKNDPRNRLILPALEVVDALRPDVVIIENVKRMLTTTVLNERDHPENLLALLRRRLLDYRVEHRLLNAASYGVPQKRMRLFVVATRDKRDAKTPLHCPATLARASYVTLAAAFAELEPLDAVDKCASASDPLHCVPKWTAHQHFCMRHTPEGATAFDNTNCAACGKSSDLTSASCTSCGVLLPRPLNFRKVRVCVQCGTDSPCPNACTFPPPKKGRRAVARTRKVERVRLVRAFRTSYRRMHASKPVLTLTTNSGVISSDTKGHPTEHRVLSVREVLIASSLSSHPRFDAPWHTLVEKSMTRLDHGFIREVVGESIPPLLLYRLVSYLEATRKDANSCAVLKTDDVR